MALDHKGREENRLNFYLKDVFVSCFNIQSHTKKTDFFRGFNVFIFKEERS